MDWFNVVGDVSSRRWGDDLSGMFGREAEGIFGNGIIILEYFNLGNRFTAEAGGMVTKPNSKTTAGIFGNVGFCRNDVGIGCTSIVHFNKGETKVVDVSVAIRAMCAFVGRGGLGYWDNGIAISGFHVRSIQGLI